MAEKMQGQMCPEAADVNPMLIGSSTEADLHSSFTGVVFSCVPSSFREDTPIKCSYRASRWADVGGNDTVGLFKVGWVAPTEKVCFQSAPTVDLRCEGSVTFPAENLPKEDGNFYQFCYINRVEEVLGASTPFQFRKGTAESDLVEEEDEDGLMVIMSRADYLQRELEFTKAREISLVEKLEKMDHENQEERKKMMGLLKMLQVEKKQLQTRCAELEESVKNQSILVVELEESRKNIQAEKKQCEEKALQLVRKIEQQYEESLEEWRQDRNALQDDKQMQIKLLQARTEETGNLERELSELKFRYQGLEHQKTYAESQLEECKELLKSKTNEILELTEKIACKDRQIQELELQKADLKKQMGRLQTECHQKEVMIQEKADKENLLLNQLDAAMGNKALMAGEVERLQMKVMELTSYLRNSEEEREMVINLHQKDTAEIVGKLKKTVEKKKVLTDELHKMTVEFANLRGSAEELVQLKVSHKAKVQELEECQKAHSANLKDLEDLKHRNRARMHELEELKKSLRASLKERDALRATLMERDASKDSHRATMHSFEELKKSYGAKVEELAKLDESHRASMEQMARQRDEDILRAWEAVEETTSFHRKQMKEKDDTIASLKDQIEELNQMKKQLEEEAVEVKEGLTKHGSRYEIIRCLKEEVMELRQRLSLAAEDYEVLRMLHNKKVEKLRSRKNKEKGQDRSRLAKAQAASSCPRVPGIPKFASQSRSTKSPLPQPGRPRYVPHCAQSSLARSAEELMAACQNIYPNPYIPQRSTAGQDQAKPELLLLASSVFEEESPEPAHLPPPLIPTHPEETQYSTSGVEESGTNWYFPWPSEVSRKAVKQPSPEAEDEEFHDASCGIPRICPGCSFHCSGDPHTLDVFVEHVIEEFGEICPFCKVPKDNWDSTERFRRHILHCRVIPSESG